MSTLVLPPLAGFVVRSREPYYGDQIDEAVSGKEYRSSWWFSPRYRYRLEYDFLRSNSLAELQAVAGFFSGHFGRLDSFLFTDPEDCSVTDHGFGVGNGVSTVFQLQRSQMRMGPIYDRIGGPWATSSKPRTNLLVRSQEFDDAAWTKSAASVSANQETAPDGTKTADRLSEDIGGPAEHRIQVGVTMSAVPYALSLFAKAGTRTKVQIRTGSTDDGGTFDLSSGVASALNNGSASIVALGNGWYRCIATHAAGGTIVYINLLDDSGNRSYTGVSNKYIYIWGAQLETGSSSTEYISTSGSAITVPPSYYPSIGSGFEPVWEPAPGISIYIDGVLQTLGTNYTIGVNGAITFASPPTANAFLSWAGNYYKRVRFSDPGMTFERVVSQWYKAGTVDLVSIKP